MKRTLALVLCFILVIPCLAFSASASEDYIPLTYSYIKEITEGDYVFYVEYEGVFYGPSYEEYLRGWKFTDGINAIKVFMEGSHPFTAFIITVDAEQEKISHNLIVDGDPLPNDCLYIAPVSSSPDSSATASPLSSVKESMSSVLDWLGTIMTSLLSGELNPLLLLLALPIAISIVFLAIKAIKIVFNL